MTPHRYGPLTYVPITRRPKLTWPGGARVALWVNPNIEFFGLDDLMPGNLNERVPRENARIPNVRNWAVRDYGNRIGIWRIMEVLTRHGIRASAALNSEVCDHHPEIIEEAGRLGWELIGHNQTNALRLTEMDAEGERDAVRATIDRIEAASGTRPVGWLGAGLAETWNTLDYLAEAGIRYVCDWVCAVTRRRFLVGASPTRQPLQPEATGAGMEATKCLKPSGSGSRIGDRASVQAATRVNAEQASKRTMCRPTRQPFRGRLIRPGEMSEEYAQLLHRGSGGSMYTRKAHATREAPMRDQG